MISFLIDYCKEIGAALLYAAEVYQEEKYVLNFITYKIVLAFQLVQDVSCDSMKF